jgi:hypothetical protein
MPVEVPMEKQLLLPLDVDGLERLRRVWKQLPDQSRVDLVARYAELIARAARASGSSYCSMRRRM